MIKDLKVEPPYNIQRGYALIIINDKFKQMRNPDRPGALVDLDNIKAFCDKVGITVADNRYQTRNLSFAGMAGLFEEVSKQDFKDYDAFFCFISSHGSQEGILGIDRIAITINQIVDLIMKNESLANKPKLFFFQNCRGSRENVGQHVAPRKLPQEDMDLSDDDTSNSATIPTHADTLIACSSWSGFKSYRDPSEGSLFITVLTKVLYEHAKTQNLTEMLQTVNRLLAKFHDGKGKRQMSCFTSSLRRTVWIKDINSDPTSGQVISCLSGQNSET